MDLFGKKQLPDSDSTLYFYDFYIGDKVKFIGINYFWQLHYYLSLDTETIYEIVNIIDHGYYTCLEFAGFGDEFFYNSFRLATIKEIRKEKLTILQSYDN